MCRTVRYVVVSPISTTPDKIRLATEPLNVTSTFKQRCTRLITREGTRVYMLSAFPSYGRRTALFESQHDVRRMKLVWPSRASLIIRLFHENSWGFPWETKAEATDAREASKQWRSCFNYATLHRKTIGGQDSQFDEYRIRCSERVDDFFLDKSRFFYLYRTNIYFGHTIVV